jgi:hypothetical protein
MHMAIETFQTLIPTDAVDTGSMAAEGCIRTFNQLLTERRSMTTPVPNGPSKVPFHPSGKGRGSNPPRAK